MGKGGAGGKESEVMLPHLFTPLPCISHAACLTSPLPAWGMRQLWKEEEKGEDSVKGPLWGFSPVQKRQTEMKALEKRCCSDPEAPAL